MKLVSVILDGGFVLKKLSHILNKDVDGGDVYNFAINCVKAGTEELFRIFFYHCSPYEEKRVNPFTGQQVDFKNTPAAQRNFQLLQDLAQRDYVAVRKGNLAFRGWTIKETSMNRIQQQIAQSQVSAASQTNHFSLRNLTNYLHYIDSSDFEADFIQKEVDIKIGLDVAWMSIQKIVNKNILVTGDTDLVPAMKFARKEGVQVVTVCILNDSNQKNYLKFGLKAHSDEVRSVIYKDGKWSIAS